MKSHSCQTLWLTVVIFSLCFTSFAVAQDDPAAPVFPPTLAQPAPGTPETAPPSDLLPVDTGKVSKTPKSGIRLQQVFVPETHETKLLEELVQTGPVKRYMTMEREKYLTLVKKLLRAKSQAAPSGARIMRASYHATWEREQLTGIAGLQVETSQKGESFAPLTGNRLAIISAAWRSTPPSEALFALTPAGEQILVVKKTGTVDLAWTLQGERNEQKAYNFDISLPQAAVTRMTLDLPVDYTPQLSAGVVAKAAVDANKDPNDPVSYATGEPAEGEVRWLLLMAPAETVRLTISQAETKDARQVISRTQVQHTITRRGLTYKADIQLDIRGGAPAELVLQTRGEMQLTTVRCNGVKRPFAYQDNGRTVVVDLPAVKPGEPCSIELSGRAPITTGSRLKLPSVTLATAGWESESVTLRIASPLRAAAIELDHCVQAGYAAAEQGGDGDTYEVHQFASSARNADVTLQLQQQPARFKAVCASSIKIGALNTSAIFVAQLSVEAQQVFSTRFTVPREWIVDTASVQPAGILDDWSITTAGLADQTLHVRLKKPIELQQSIVVTLRMHRRVRADLLPTSTGLLELADIPDADQISRTTGVYTSPPFLLKLTNDGELTRLDQQKIPAGLKAMLDVPNRAIVYQGSSDKARFRLLSETVQYSGELETTAVVDGGTLEETHSIRCTPSVAGVSSLLVHFAENGTSPIQWRVAGSGAGSLVTEQLTEDEQQRMNVGAGETYRIDFDRPRRKPFILEGVRTSVLKATHQLPLPSLPSAVSQTGLLLIGVKNGEEMAISAGALRTAPLPIALPGATPVMRAAYVFDPAQTAVVSLDAKPQVRQAVWAWASEAHSRFGDHSVSHRIAYKLQNEGEESVAIKLPATATQVAVHVNNSLVPSVSESGAHVIPLPEGERFPLVTVQFVEPVAFLAKWAELPPPAVTPVFQVMEHRWTVATVPGYKIQSTGSPKKSTASRIFGGFYTEPEASDAEHSWERFWRSEVWAETPADSRIQNVRLVFGQLWKEPVDANSENPRTWQALLESYEDMRLSETDLRLPVLEIDSISVHRAGVRPGTSLPPPEAESEVIDPSAMELREAGETLLQEVGLRLSTTDAGVVLASRPNARRALNGAAPSRMDVGTWVSAQPYITSPWLEASPAGGESDGWKMQSDVISTEPPAAVTVFQPAFWRAAGWVALFLSAIGVIWLLRRAPLWVLPVTGIAIVVAVTAPDVVAPVTTGVCLGCIAAAFVLAIHSSLEHTKLRLSETDDHSSVGEPEDSAESQAATASFRAPSLIILIAMTSVYAQLHAAEPASDVIDYKVVIPVDDDEKPVGHVFVPKPVFDQMLTLESDDAGTGYPWLITRADYTCQISRGAADGTLQISGCTARFQMVVRRRGAKVKLPFSSRQLDLLPGSVKIDGAEAEFAWSAGGDSLEVDTTETGVQELSITFIPRISSVAKRSSLDITVPPAPAAELRVKTSEDINSLEVASALGATRIDTASGDLLIALGPSNKLQINWPQLNEDAAAQQPSAKQLVWLQIQPKSVLCRTAITLVAPQSKAIRTLEFEVDARLQITAGRSANISSIMVSPGTSATGMKRVSLLLDRDYQGEEFSIHVSYLVTGATGIGVTRLPRIDIASCRTLRQWFAVSIEKGLQHSIQGEGELPPQSASAFKTAWQQAGAPLLTLATPDVAYAAMPGEQQYQVLTSPPMDPVSATVREILLAGSEKITYQAAIEIEAGDTQNYHHAFSELGRIIIQEVTMLKGGAATPLEFAASESGSLSVFSEKPLSGNYTIRLRGELRKGKKFSRRSIWHTMLQCNNALVDQHYIDLYRYYDAAIKVSRLIKLEPNLEDTQPEIKADARIAGRWKVQASAGGNPTLPRINFEISPNRPRAECHRLVRLDRVDGSWKAAMLCQGTVNRGQMDTLRIEFSSQWTAPFQCDPPAKVTIEPVPGSERSRMHLEFEKPLKGEFNVRVTGSLQPASGERIAAPLIEPLDMVRVERRLLLPMRAQEQLFNWKTGGLIKDPLPAIFSDEIPDDPTAAYRVVGAQPKAEIVDVKNIRGTPQVWLSDIHLKWSSDGHAAGVATFDLEPGGLDQFDVRLPAGWNLISIHVGAAPVLTEPTDENRFRITSALRQLPQRISVVFDARLKQHADGWAIEPPELVGIPVVRQLWTIYGPGGVAQTVSQSDKRVDTRQQEIFRHKVICNVIEGAADTLGESNPRDVARWNPAWVKRLVQSRNRFNRLPAADGDTVDPLEVDHQAVAERLERWAGDMTSWVAPPVAGSPADVFTVQHRAQTPMRLAFRGASTGFAVQEHQPLVSRTQNIMTGILVAFGLCVVWWFLRLPAVAAIAMRCRYVLGVAMGILWWMLLTPAVAGLIFAAVCILAAILQRSSRKNLQQNGSAPASL